jgi:surfeit locus 1 family protein
LTPGQYTRVHAVVTALDEFLGASYHCAVMHIGPYRFRRPRLVPTLATLLLFPALISLGFWQLHRADVKYAARAVREHNRDLPQVNLTPDFTDLNSALNRRARAQGHFDLSHQLLLDNQTHNNVPGYYVFTPLVLAGTRTAVLVNRGWVPQGLDRRVLPPLPGPTQAVDVTGLIDSVPVIGLKLGPPNGGYTDWPKLVQYLDMKWLEGKLGYHLLPYVVLLKSGQSFGFLRDWSGVQIGHEAMPPEKHMGYAVQWFVMAGVLVIIFIGVHTRRDEEDK